VIKSFGSKESEALFRGQTSRRLPTEIQRRALQKLVALNAAISLDELRNIPGNRLEKLRGDMAGQYSLRINDQWRVCFRWHNGDAFDVEIVDYHA